MRRLLWVGLFSAFVAACQSEAKLEGRAFECDTELDCRDGWFCGLDGRCKQPDAGEPRACRGAPECAPGWNCGPTAHGDGGQCFDTATGAATFCRFVDAGQSANLDCGGGFRCGADSTCFDPNDPQPRECDEDLDCAQSAGFFCSALAPRRCASITAESQAATLPLTAVAEVVSPRIAPEPRPGFFAQQPYIDRSAQGEVMLVVVSDGGVYRLPAIAGASLIYEGLLPTASPSISLSDGVIYFREGARVIRRTAPGTDQELSFSGATPSFLRAIPDGGVAVIMTGRGLHLVSNDAASLSSVPVLLPPEVTTVHDFTPFGTSGYLISSPQGLFVSERANTGWRQIDGGTSATPDWIAVDHPDAPNIRCDGGYLPDAGSPGPLAGSSSWAAFAARTPIGDGKLATLRWRGDKVTGGLTIAGQVQCFREPAGAPPDANLFEAYSVPARACVGSSIESISALARRNFSSAPERSFLITCAPVPTDPMDGGPNELQRQTLVYEAIASSQVSSFQFPDLPQTLIADTTSKETAAVLSGSGELIHCNATQPHCAARLLQGRVRSIVGGPDAGLMVIASKFKSDRPYVTDSPLGQLFPEAFLDGTMPNAPVGGVLGDERLFVDSLRPGPLFLRRFNPETAAPAPLLPVANEFGLLENSHNLGEVLDNQLASSFGVQTTTRDGQPVTVIAAADRIWAGAPAPGSNLPIRLVPLSLATITSFTAEASSTANPAQLSGYVLAQERLIRWSADTLTRWRANELALPQTLPTESADPLAVWSTGSRSRLTMVDGHTYSLPSLVKLTENRNPGDFRQVLAWCGTAWGRTSSSLHRLKKDGSARFAEWEEVPLPYRRPGISTRLAEGLLHVAGDSLYVVDSVGNIVRFTDPSCPQASSSP